MKIYVARHGQNEDNAAGILNGHRNKRLTPLGRQQAIVLGHTIKELGIFPDKVEVSPLGRAIETAIIAGFTRHFVEPGLIERNFGSMTGKLISEIKTLCAPDIIETELITYFLNVPGAETFPVLLERAKREIQRMKDDPYGTRLLFTHGDFGKMLYCAYYDLDWMSCLVNFHFGNSELLLLSPDTHPDNAHVFKQEQHNH